MKSQVESWRKHNVYSEMSEPIRALYELLAGNSLRSDGKPGGFLEDRTSTFYLSERFDLDWIQAFGLRLWYGITDGEPIEAAVAMFHHDITHGNEPAYPFAWRLEEESETGQNDSDSLSRESPLWVVLKAYAVAMSNGETCDIQPVHLPQALLPESVSGDRLQNRLSFQLHQALSAVAGQHNALVIDAARADQLSWDYAWELGSNGQYPQATFVLLHLLDATDRERSVKEILARFAAYLPTPIAPDGTPSSLWHYLADELQIPVAWIWVAKALYARDRGDASSEVDYLIRGKNWNEAHATFCRVVGPKAVIERDYLTLESLISGFGDGPERKVRGWTSGGAVYEDFLRLVTARSGRPDQIRLKRLVGALAALGERVEKRSAAGLEERVAFREISRVVARWCARDAGSVSSESFLARTSHPGFSPTLVPKTTMSYANRTTDANFSLLSMQSIEPTAILSLPLTQDARLLHTAEMSRRYYGSIMAGGH
jgi:nuclear pore complex protein Nup98-Nup96